jgi:hypothetical protein
MRFGRRFGANGGATNQDQYGIDDGCGRESTLRSSQNRIEVYE